MWLLKTALVGLAVFIAGLIAYILVVSPGRVWVRLAWEGMGECERGSRSGQTP